MKPVKTENSNHNFGPPHGKEGEIGDLPCQRVDHDDGTRTYFSTWELNDADRQAIANGENLQLGVAWIGAFPPISLGITHEKRLVVEEAAPFA
jgi:hypothetical protein